MKLSEVKAGKDELVQRLERHKITLRSLWLGSLYPASAAWTSTVITSKSLLYLEELLPEALSFNHEPETRRLLHLLDR